MINVFLTIDTECSMGGALDDRNKRPVGPDRSVLGKVGSKEYGTPLMMDVLEGEGLRGTFFIETLASKVVDRELIEEAYRAIVARGHDVQLHVHPVYYFYHRLCRGLITQDQLPARPDFLCSMPYHTQAEILREAADCFHQMTGKIPVAFRAGSFAADDRTLQALETLAIEYDSSFNAVALGKTCQLLSREPNNAVYRVSKIWEVPVTNFETGFGRFRGFKPLNIASVSWSEMIHVLNSAEACNLQNVVFILHSFAFLKWTDVQFRDCRPDRMVMRRFEKLCRYLNVHRDRFAVRTFGDRPIFDPQAAVTGFPSVGLWLSVPRKLAQAVNRIHWI